MIVKNKIKNIAILFYNFIKILHILRKQHVLDKGHESQLNV